MVTELHLIHESSTLIKHIPSVVIVFDEQGRIYQWNPVAEKVFGYSAEEVIGRKMKHVYPEKSTLIADLWHRLLQYETLEQLIIKPRHKAGYEFWLGMLPAPIYDDSNTFNDVILIGRELSAEKRDMEELTSQRTARFQAE